MKKQIKNQKWLFGALIVVISISLIAAVIGTNGSWFNGSTFTLNQGLFSTDKSVINKLLNIYVNPSLKGLTINVSQNPNMRLGSYIVKTGIDPVYISRLKFTCTCITLSQNKCSDLIENLSVNLKTSKTDIGMTKPSQYINIFNIYDPSTIWINYDLHIPANQTYILDIIGTPKGPINEKFSFELTDPSPSFANSVYAENEISGERISIEKMGICLGGTKIGCTYNDNETPLVIIQ